MTSTLSWVLIFIVLVSLLIHIRTTDEVGTINLFKPSIEILLTVSRQCFFCGSFLVFFILSYLFLQSCDHLLGKDWPLGSLVCDVFLSLCHFPIWCFESGVVLDCIGDWSLSSLILVTRQHQGYKTFFMLNSTELEIILLINVTMQTIAGLLTFISRINTTSESLKARKIYIF